jgi:uncharacterized protein YcfJ
MTRKLKAALAIAAVAAASQAFADVTLYQVENLRGRAFTAQSDIPNLERFGFNDRASSVEVTGDRRDRWEVCENAGYSGRCAVLRPGSYNSILAMGLNNRISSVRQIAWDERVSDNRYAPVYREEYRSDFRRRDGERLFEARVTQVRAVVAGPTQRCWIEREQVVGNPPSSNVGGAVAGALIGGILGHQIGGGSGRDAATALGAIGGAAIGANSGSSAQVISQDVQRCEQRVSARPDYYDVSYVFEGREHRVQMAQPPGAHVLVNGAGEPRG